MAVDCLGRSVKVGDWVSYTNTWQNAEVRVGKIAKIVDKKLKSGLDRVHPKFMIVGRQGWESTVNRSRYLCLLEVPFECAEGVLGVGDKYKM